MFRKLGAWLRPTHKIAEELTAAQKAARRIGGRR